MNQSVRVRINMQDTNLGVLCTGNRDNILTLLKQPCEGDLSSRCIVLLPDLPDGVDKLEDLGEVSL